MATKKTKKKIKKKAVKKVTKKKSGKKTTRKKAAKTSSASSNNSVFDSPPFSSFSVEKDITAVPQMKWSRKPVIFGIIIVVILSTLVVINRDKIFGGKDKAIVENGKKVETIASKKDGKKDIKKDVVPTDKFHIHTVVKGDTLFGIARKYLGKAGRYPEIMKLNGLAKASDAKLGFKLKIPPK